MSSGSAAPPLPPPPHPAATARVLSETARAAADAWAQPMETAQFNRALSQLYSVLRDLGIATRGLARYQTTGYPADPAPLGFPRRVRAGAAGCADPLRPSGYPPAPSRAAARRGSRAARSRDRK